MTVTFKADQVFDRQRMRHSLNGEVSVLHCHHYSTLFTQLADDADWLNGPQLMVESAEESFYPVLCDYYRENGVQTPEERVRIVEQYFGHIGLGQLTLKSQGDEWSAEMAHSHVDEGWIKKWGNRDKAVNFVGQGFLAAAVAAINDDSQGVYRAAETKSIVKGADASKFTITRK